MPKGMISCGSVRVYRPSRNWSKACSELAVFECDCFVRFVVVSRYLDGDYETLTHSKAYVVDYAKAQKATDNLLKISVCCIKYPWIAREMSHSSENFFEWFWQQSNDSHRLCPFQLMLFVFIKLLCTELRTFPWAKADGCYWLWSQAH